MAGLTTLLAIPHPAAAQATSTTCGNPPTATCTGDYPNGIQYLDLGDGGASSELTLTVQPGASGTSTIVNQGTIDPGINGVGIHIETSVITNRTEGDGGAGDITIKIEKGVMIEGKSPKSASASGAGIFLQIYGVKGQNNRHPVKLDMEGTIKAKSNGVYINQRFGVGDIVLNLDGAITHAGRNGVRIYKGPDPDNSGDIKVALKPGARVGVDGDAPTVARHGFYLVQHAKRGGIEMTVERDAKIGTEENPVGWDGVWASIEDHDRSGNIRITNHGFMHVKGSGIYAWNMGRGDIVVRHEAGGGGEDHRGRRGGAVWETKR